MGDRGFLNAVFRDISFLLCFRFDSGKILVFGQQSFSFIFCSPILSSPFDSLFDFHVFRFKYIPRKLRELECQDTNGMKMVLFSVFSQNGDDHLQYNERVVCDLEGYFRVFIFPFGLLRSGLSYFCACLVNPFPIHNSNSVTTRYSIRKKAPPKSKSLPFSVGLPGSCCL